MRMCCLPTGLFGMVLAVAGAARGEVTAAIGHNPSPMSVCTEFSSSVNMSLPATGSMSPASKNAESSERSVPFSEVRFHASERSAARI